MSRSGHRSRRIRRGKCVKLGCRDAGIYGGRCADHRGGALS